MSMSVSMPHDGDVAMGVLGMESIDGCTGRVCIEGVSVLRWR
jgi:hypothetical protein